MLWPLVAPLKITAYTIASLVVVAVLLAPVLGWKRRNTLLCTSLLGLAVFVPSCTGIMKVVDKMRFGGFAYPDVRSISDSNISGWLPSDARDITVYCSTTGHHARFRIDEDTLVAWLRKVRSGFGEGEDSAADDTDEMKSGSINEEYFKQEFGGFGWEYPSDAVELSGPYAANGAGFTVWYSKTQGLAYLRAGYW